MGTFQSRRYNGAACPSRVQLEGWTSCELIKKMDFQGGTQGPFLSEKGEVGHVSLGIWLQACEGLTRVLGIDRSQGLSPYSVVTL